MSGNISPAFAHKIVLMGGGQEENHLFNFGQELVGEAWQVTPHVEFDASTQSILVFITGQRSEYPLSKDCCGHVTIDSLSFSRVRVTMFPTLRIPFERWRAACRVPICFQVAEIGQQSFSP